MGRNAIVEAMAADADWSKETVKTVKAATDGLSLSAQHRFASAWHSMRRDWERQAKTAINDALQESWNAYLSRIVPTMIKRGQILQLHGMLIFIADYPATVDHERIASAVRRKLGRKGEARYREVIADFLSHIGIEPAPTPH
jgi:hypothetical protein